jgi:flavin-dependent dehydrogenase
MYDVAIIGAGPAGATLARLIGDQYKVLLIEKRRLPDQSEGFSAIKCCGGLLAPDAQMMLSKLGLGLPKSVLEDPHRLKPGFGKILSAPLYQHEPQKI